MWPVPESDWPTSTARSAVWQRDGPDGAGRVEPVPPVPSTFGSDARPVGVPPPGGAGGRLPTTSPDDELDDGEPCPIGHTPPGPAGTRSGEDWQPTAATATTTPPTANSHLDVTPLILVIPPSPSSTANLPRPLRRLLWTRLGRCEPDPAGCRPAPAGLIDYRPQRW